MKISQGIFQIKKIIAILLTIVFCVLSLKGNITSTEFLTIFGMIISTYFSQSSIRQVVKENNINRSDDNDSTNN